MATPWYTSKTILGIIIAAVATIAQRWGLTLTEADQAQIVDAVAVIGQALGGGLAVYGRAAAKGPLSVGGSPVGILLAICLTGTMLSGCVTQYDAATAAALGVASEIHDREMDAARLVTCDNHYGAEARYQARHSISPAVFGEFCGRNRGPAR